ncbi:MAG TPA: RICIN domain-containing protein [Burkholderiaceae bacterium]|nr:RICIN domain-containing protein [Burkholderiaceae bacterium]
MKTVNGLVMPLLCILLAACGNNVSESQTAPPQKASAARKSETTPIISGTIYTLINPNSGMALDVTAAGIADGTPVHIYTPNSTIAQQWQINRNSNGTYSLFNANSGKDLDVVAAGTANGTGIDIYTPNGTGAQQWQIDPNNDGSVTLINPNSGNALDIVGAGTAAGTAVDLYAANGTVAQKWVLTPVITANHSALGANVLVFDSSMSAAAIQSQLDAVYSLQRTSQFGAGRYAVLFKPGTYNVNVNVGFYMQALGLGVMPDDTVINGTINLDASWLNDTPHDATQNFWRSAENIAVIPNGGTTMWAAAQASPLRRVHVRGNLILADNGGWASGGFMADTIVDGQVDSSTQQQWMSRNSQWNNWAGADWNMVFLGDINAPTNSFPNPPYTIVGQTPLVREKPFLTIDSSGNYGVFQPAFNRNTSGTTWATGTAAGTTLPLSRFYIAQAATDTAASINAALISGLNLILTPGVYQLTAPINVTNPNTVILGLGLATLMPTTGSAAMTVGDVDGVEIAGLLFDAGTKNSPVLLQMGPVVSAASHKTNPSTLHDVFFRIGGAAIGSASVSLQINSNNVIGDDLWIWRADHGNGIGWDINTAANGLVVNGANVSMYGLAVEHYQQYQTLWNGNGGQVYFYQSEAPYDVPNQAAWMDGNINGYASYKVASSVTSHQAWGIGIYCYFNVNPGVQLSNAIAVPQAGLNGAMFHNMTTVSLGGLGQINSIIDGWGAAANAGNPVSRLNQ